MTVVFRYARFDDYPQISAFLDQYWAKDHVYVRIPTLFHWTFHRNGLWDQEGYSFALAEEGKEIVGILGGIPFVFNHFGHTSWAMWSANFMVRPDHRRGPVALRLLSMLQHAPYQTFIIFGANTVVLPIYRALHAQILEEIPRHFAILPGNVERMTHLLHLTYPDWSRSRMKALAQAVQLTELPEISGEAEHTLPADWDISGWRPWATQIVGAARDMDYLRWRYLEHPCFTYRVISVPEGDRLGLAIWRLETIRRLSPHGLEEVDRLGRLVELLPTSRTNAQALLSHFWRELIEADALGADYYGYHGTIRGWLRDLGFPEVLEQPDGEAIPARFQPLDSKGGRIRSAIFAQPTIPPCSLDLQCVWYWTKSDADQDRPN